MAPVHGDRPSVGLIETHDHTYRCGLSSPVGSEEAGHVSRFDVEAEIVNREFVAVTLREAPGRNRVLMRVGTPVPSPSNCSGSRPVAASCLPAFHRGG